MSVFKTDWRPHAATFLVMSIARPGLEPELEDSKSGDLWADSTLTPPGKLLSAAPHYWTGINKKPAVETFSTAG